MHKLRSASVKILRSPEHALDGLADYPLDRRWVTVPAGDGQELSIHVVDTGPPDGQPVVFLHGNPAWSYVWRRQISAATDHGFRVLAPDHVGTGLSDKPSEMTDYTVARHVDWMGSCLFERLDLHDILFVLQDWGSVIGLRLIAEHPDRVAGVVVSSGGLPARDPREPLPEVIEPKGPFADFQRFARDAPSWEPWSLLPLVMITEPTPELIAAYRAPYPDPSLTIGSRAFTQLLPTTPDNPMLPDNFRAWQALERFDRPFLTLFSDKDQIAADGWKQLVERIPGARGQPHRIIEDAGHFLQEDKPEEYTAALVDWLVQNRSSTATTP